MATRSTISIMNPNNTVTTMYCHSDGYLSHHAPILLRHYNTEKKVRALLELRSLSVLGETIGRKHKFDKVWPHSKPRPCTSHYRDHGDKYFNVFIGPLDRLPGEEWNYLFRKGQWEVSQDCETWELLVAAAVADKLTQE